MTKRTEKNQPAKQEEPQVVQHAKQRPVHEVKLAFNGGLLCAAVWRHQNDQGKPWHSVSLSRAHKSAANGEWSYGDSFSRDELLGLMRVIGTVYDDIVYGVVAGEKQSMTTSSMELSQEKNNE